MSSVFVTVGMGPWPFDRLVRAVAPLCAEHDVFVQTGTSSVVPPCPHQPFLGPAETLRRIRSADVVVTHGGNTVRLAQRARKVPIAVAREAARGEMRNDHQVAYLAGERASGRVRVLGGDEPALPVAVADHAAVQARMLAAAPPLPPPADPDRLAEALDAALLPARGPFDRHPLARYRWAWAQLAARTGRHLDLGVGDGTLTWASVTAPSRPRCTARRSWTWWPSMRTRTTSASCVRPNPTSRWYGWAPRCRSRPPPSTR